MNGPWLPALAMFDDTVAGTVVGPPITSTPAQAKMSPPSLALPRKLEPPPMRWRGYCPGADSLRSCRDLMLGSIQNRESGMLDCWRAESFSN